MNHISRLALLLALIITLSACGMPPERVRLGGVDYRAPVVAPYVAPPLAKPLTPTSKLDSARLADYNKLLDDFESRAPTAFERRDTLQHLPGIERFYLETARMFDLAKLYRKAYDRHGPDHYVAARLAWTYLYLNDIPSARATLDAARIARPDDPLVHFVEGSLITREKKGQLEVAIAVRDAWTRCINLDPSFKGPLGVSAAILRVRLVEINKMITRGGGNATPIPTAGQVSPTPSRSDSPGPVDADLLRGDAFLASEKYLDAAEAYRTVLTKDPKTLPDTVNTQRRAQVGFALAAWRHPGKLDTDKATLALQLAIARPDLSAPELYALLQIFATKLNDPVQTKVLVERLKTLDPAFASDKKAELLLSK